MFGGLVDKNLQGGAPNDSHVGAKFTGWILWFVVDTVYLLTCLDEVINQQT